MTDCVDGLVTGTANSLFTTVVLPYMCMDQTDRKIQCNTWTFDLGVTPRVPYESGNTIRQGLAIAVEDNFMETFDLGVAPRVPYESGNTIRQAPSLPHPRHGSHHLDPSEASQDCAQTDGSGWRIQRQ